jgi:hypothetical protein
MEQKRRRCKIEGCKGEYRAKGYCRKHYKKWRRGELPKPRYKTCSVEDCIKPVSQRGKCAEHASKKAKHKE